MKAEDVQLLATHAAEAVNRLSAADPKGAAVIDYDGPADAWFPFDAYGMEMTHA